MITSNIEEVNSRLLGKITDREILDLANKDYDEITGEYLHATLGLPYIRSVFKTIKVDDVLRTITYELAVPEDDDSDKDFVLELLARGSLVAWLENKVQADTLLKFMVGTSKEKYFSQANHMTAAQSLLELNRTKLDEMVCGYGFIHNAYIID